MSSQKANEILKYGSEPVRNYVDSDGDIKPLSDLSDSEITDAFIDFARQNGSVPDVTQPAVEPIKPFLSPSEHKPGKRWAVSGPQYGDGGSIDTGDGQPHYFNRDPSIGTEQRERNHRYISNIKEIGARAVELHATLDAIEADIAATTERHDRFEIGHPLRGRESNRLDILHQQRENTVAKLRELGENIE